MSDSLSNTIASFPAPMNTVAFAKVDSDGTILFGHGMQVSYVSTGTYDITLDDAHPSADYIVLGQVFNTTTDTNLMVSNQAAGAFRVTIGEGDNSSTPDVLIDTPFFILSFC